MYCLGRYTQSLRTLKHVLHSAKQPRFVKCTGNTQGKCQCVNQELCVQALHHSSGNLTP